MTVESVRELQIRPSVFQTWKDIRVTSSCPHRFLMLGVEFYYTIFMLQIVKLKEANANMSKQLTVSCFKNKFCQFKGMKPKQTLWFHAFQIKTLKWC